MIKIKELLSRTSNTLINLYKRYPITIIIITSITIFLSIFVGMYVFKDSTIEKVTIFGIVWSISTILIETLNLKSKKVNIISYVITALIAFILVKLPQNTYGVFNEHLVRITTGYCLCLFALTLYFIIKKTGVSFGEYLIKIFNNIFNSSIIYGVLNIGMTLIIVIFVELILDGTYGEFILRSQILLLGLFYFPALLNSISDIKEKSPSSFIKGLVKYVLLPLVTIAMLIIYIYIAKILIQREMPSNIIFRILAGIFIVAFPVWNMASIFKEQKIIYKISKILPYTYIPFIFLEIYSVGIRIIDFGLTPIRYIGIAFILFQIIVLLFTTLKRKINLEYGFIVLAVIIFITCITPLNFNTISKLNQKNIMVANLPEGTNFEYLKDEAKQKVHSAYVNLKNNYGSEYIPEYIENMNNEINDYSPVSKNYRQNEYFTFFEYGEEINVNEYSSILPVRTADSKYNNGNIELSDYDNNYITNVGIRTIVEETLRENKKTSDYAENYLLQNRYVYVNNLETLYITNMNLTYNNSTDEVIAISLSGFLLKK